MTQHDMTIANQNFPAFRSDLNDGLQALASTSKGNTRPSTVYGGQLWLDDNTPSSTVWSLYLYDGTDDILFGYVDSTNNVFAAADAQAQTVASASTINLDAAYGRVVDVSGTTTITAVTLAQGQVRIVRFTGALTLTHGANLVLPGAANITTAAGDFATLVGYGSSVVRCATFSPAAGTAPTTGTWTPAITFATPGNLAVTYGTQAGSWRRVGDRVKADFTLVTSAFTHTTAGGNLQITGLPVNTDTAVLAVGALHWQGVTKAGYTDVCVRNRAADGNDRLVLGASGSGQAADFVTKNDTPTGGSIVLTGSIEYKV